MTMPTFKERAVFQPRLIPASPAALMPIPTRKPATTLPVGMVRPFHPVQPVPAGPPLRAPATRTYAVQSTAGWISRLSGYHLTAGHRIEVELPPGSPDRVNAATLKRLLGARQTDRILKKTGQAWTICEDDAPIDLRDTTTEYRVGPVALYS